MTDGCRTFPTRRPDPTQDRLEPDAVLVGGEGLDDRLGVAGPLLGDRVGEVSLTAACSSGVAARTWRGRGRVRWACAAASERVARRRARPGRARRGDRGAVPRGPGGARAARRGRAPGIRPATGPARLVPAEAVREPTRERAGHMARPKPKRASPRRCSRAPSRRPCGPGRWRPAARIPRASIGSWSAPRHPTRTWRGFRSSARHPDRPRAGARPRARGRPPSAAGPGRSGSRVRPAARRPAGKRRARRRFGSEARIGGPGAVWRREKGVVLALLAALGAPRPRPPPPAPAPPPARPSRPWGGPGP